MKHPEPLVEADKENSLSPAKSPLAAGKASKGRDKSPSRSPLAPADNNQHNAAPAAGAGGRTRPVYGKDGTITHVPLKSVPTKAKEDVKPDNKGLGTRKRVLSPMRSTRNGNQENAPKVFHTAKSRAREAALKVDPKPIKEESNHPMAKRLRTRGGL